jgi:glycosyltransferase involved in cell wall biosynthesis
MRGRTLQVGLVAPTVRLLGGHSVQAARLIEAWRDDADVTVRLIPINPTPPRFLAALSRIKFVRTLVTQLCYWPLLMREVRRVDVLHVFATSNASFFRAAAPAILVGWLYRRRLVVNYRGDGRAHLARSAVARRILRRVRVAVPSAYFQAICAEFRIPSEIVPNIANLMQFRYRPRDTLRPRLLSTRNFEPIYNVACTLRAFARVQVSYPHASLVLVGGGTQERALRRLASDLGLRHVSFAGYIGPDTISQFYNAADIYVQTPTIDNMPGSVIEAFASGLPVVATRVGGVPLIVEHGAHGLLAPSEDDEAVAGHVLELLKNPAEARRMAAAAMATCGAYAPALVRERWRAVYCG